MNQITNTNHDVEHRGKSLSEDRVSLMIDSSINEALVKHEEKMVAHFDSQFILLRECIKEAFPNGDPHSHRMAHEKEIEASNNWKKMKAEVATKFVSGGLWVAVVWLCYAIWQAFLNSLHR